MRDQARSYEGKVAFVTGAANGIGRATALAFAREGANVAVADISEIGNQETARIIEERGGRALAVKFDVTRAEDVKAALDRTIDAFGRLDAAFNNAGAEQPVAAIADLTEEEWDRVVSVNLRSVFLCMKYEIPLMLKQGNGVIVNTSSGAGVKGIAGSGRVLRGETRRNRPDQGGCSRLRAVEHPGERSVPRNHRHADDGSLHWRHRPGAGKGDRAGAGWTNG